MDIPYFNGFTKIYSTQINISKDIADENLRLVFGEFKKLYIIDANDIPEINRNQGYLNYYNMPKTIYCDPLVRFYYYYTDYIVYPYLNYVSIDDMKNEPVKSIMKNNHFLREYTKASIIAKIEKVAGEYFMVYYINSKIIQNLVANKKESNKNMQLLTNILINQKQIDLIKENEVYLRNILNTLPSNMKSTQPKKIQMEFQDSNLLRQDVTLYDYQKDDIIWMNKIEEDVLNGNNIIKYAYTPAYGVLDNKFLVHNETLLPIYFDINESPYKINREFKFLGGNIISEVGLGKTLIVLYHILKSKDADNYFDNFVDFHNNCNYFYKRGKLKGTACEKQKNNDLYCKTHSKTVFIDKRRLIFRNLDDFNINNFLYSAFGIKYIKTSATLVICPNHLCDQWVQEYYSKFNNNHRVVLIVTYDQYTNVTLADLLFADIVIVSYNFILNKKYINSKSVDGIRTVLQLHCDKIDPTNEDKTNILNSNVFTKFELFHWDRVVLDEVHEIQNMSSDYQIKAFIKNIVSTYKWNISGTPFANGVSSFTNLMSYNTSYSIEVTPEWANTNDLITLGFNSGIIDKCSSLFRRNTKQTVKSEYEGNILKEFVHLLEFTAQERSIYDSFVRGGKSNFYDSIIKLCCHPELNNDTKEMIRNCKTFDEIHQCLVNYNKTLLDKRLQQIKTAETEITYYENELKKYIEPYCELILPTVTEFKTALSNFKRQLVIHKKAYDEISRTYNYLKSSVDQLKDKDEELTCPICLDEIDKENIAITKCGHKFCWECIYETHQVQKQNNNEKIKCPTCNTFISNSELYLLENGNQDKNIEKTELDNIVQKVKSTKIGNIIYFLKTSLKQDDKVILFSQWDELLHKVGDILAQEKINIVYCKGTVYQRKRAISTFQKDQTINVIMLSSRNAASGINLTAANKIILLEPIYGNLEYRQNIESQAIGRADRLGQKRPIEIHRFIIKDTIEQDILNNSVDDSKIRQLSI
jgi:SNF2 family DNA or RNA helicase